MRVTVSGWKGTESRQIIYEMIDYFDDESGLTSMMRTTAFPATVTAIMSADGTISDRGVLPAERCIPPAPFIKALQDRGIPLVLKEV